ncbi:hypothetical protein OAQ96_02475 [Alphaproteobacteria bacterium]|nr:hypothetical protein [Alphaproteobacteria bacterium]
MKTLLTLFVLLFSYSLVANDISDFEIEGMSVGDSLLDYFSEEEIIKNIRSDGYIGSDGKFSDAIFKNIPIIKIYDGLQIAFKSKDKNFIIHAILGTIFFEENNDECYLKQSEIDKEISILLKGVERREYPKELYPGHDGSYHKGITYWFNRGVTGGTIDLRCYDWNNKKLGWQDYFQIGTNSYEYHDWIIEYQSIK